MVCKEKYLGLALANSFYNHNNRDFQGQDASTGVLGFANLVGTGSAHLVGVRYRDGLYGVTDMISSLGMAQNQRMGSNASDPGVQ